MIKNISDHYKNTNIAPTASRMYLGKVRKLEGPSQLKIMLPLPLEEGMSL